MSFVSAIAVVWLTHTAPQTVLTASPNDSPRVAIAPACAEAVVVMRQAPALFVADDQRLQMSLAVLGAADEVDREAMAAAFVERPAPLFDRPARAGRSTAAGHRRFGAYLAKPCCDPARH